ncbi:MAG TPA: phage gp6-like head-tail connector protein [Methylococcaceae bacterium]|nr:phage gp6-like head-tail connector protein [Methylococcaceae bacterium]
MWPTLNDIKKQCVLDEDDTSDDELLTIYLFAARNHISQKLNRKLVDLTSQIEVDSETGLPVNEYDLALDTDAGHSIKLAALLVIGHWYLNRESTDTLTIKEVPMSFNALLESYRVY